MRFLGHTITIGADNSEQREKLQNPRHFIPKDKKTKNDVNSVIFGMCLHKQQKGNTDYSSGEDSKVEKLQNSGDWPLSYNTTDNNRTT